VDEGNLIKFGKSNRGVQRYRCKSCTTTFAATRGTLFYRKHTPLKDILETLALVAEGVRISSLSRAKGFKEDTILRWLREAARHSEAVEEVLMADYRLSKAQVDGLWTYVGHKGQKGATKRARIPESSGVAR
jgi:transposase-like protein